MSRSLKRIVLILGGTAVFVVLVALIVPLLTWASSYKPRLEAAVGCLGMGVGSEAG
jgi:uncharacterized protein involved in outer membrane biogenesis